MEHSEHKQRHIKDTGRIFQSGPGLAAARGGRETVGYAYKGTHWLQMVLGKGIQ